VLVDDLNSTHELFIDFFGNFIKYTFWWSANTTKADIVINGF
jgi:hypothetical protein